MRKLKLFCIGMATNIFFSIVVPITVLATETNQVIENSQQTTQAVETQNSESSNLENKRVEDEQSQGSSETQEATSSPKETDAIDNPLENELDEDLKNNPYFPSKPTEEDIAGSKVKPGEIPLPDDSYQRNFSTFSSSINQYIINKKYPNPVIQYNYKPQFPKMNYKDGLGKPRGVVVHETANPNSTIWNEINYMSNNWQNAFVHTFVDANNIVEIHPTDYSVWGAGAQANPYFIQIELVEHVNNKEDFYKSINNDAYYIAYNLKKYNLVPSRSGGGPGNPTGTVWSHHEVSSKLGGTNHTDPTGYFAKFNYTFSEFFELVQYKFNQLNFESIVSEGAFSGNAEIKNSSFGIFTRPEGTVGATKVADSEKYLGKNIEIVSKAVLSNKKEYYQIKVDGTIVGWINSAALYLFDVITYQQSKNFIAIIKPADEVGHHGLYNGIYNTAPNVTKIGTAEMYEGQEVTVLEQATTKHSSWFRYKINNQEIGWLDTRAFEVFDEIKENNPVNLEKKVIDKNNEYAIYSDIFNTKPNIQEVGKISNYQGQVLKISRAAKTEKSMWYLITNAGKEVGWVDSRAFSDPDKIELEEDISYPEVIINNKAKEFSVYNGIFGAQAEVGIVGKGSDFLNKEVQITKKIKTNQAGWYLFESAGKEIGWMDERAFTIQNMTVYQAHMQNINEWQAPSINGQVSGLTGKATGIDGFKVKLENQKFSGGIEYSARIQGYGWQSTMSNNSESGFPGSNRQIEIIKMNLTGEMAKQYDIYYQTHVQSFGWLDWAKNGDYAGSVGYDYRIEAIRVMIVKKGDPAPGATKEPFKEYVKPAKVNYSSYVQNKGWQGYVSDGETSGTSKQNLRLEGLKVNLSDQPVTGGIEYSTRIQNYGWQANQNNNSISGFPGQNLQVEIVKMNLTGEMAKQYDIYYQTHVQNFGWLDWAKNGENSGSINYGYRIEAIQIRLVEKGGKAPGPTKDPFKEYVKVPKVAYNSYVQGQGWQGDKFDGALSGTNKQNLRLEGLKINLLDLPVPGGVEYSTRIQNYGWQTTQSNGAVSGFVNSGLQIEIVKMKLTGQLADKYDIYYRTHVQNIGWLGWAKNGTESGTLYYGYRIEAINIQLVEKNSPAPGSTENSFLEYIKPPTISYSSYVQNQGWQQDVTNGSLSGTTGKALRLEALRLNMTDTKLKGQIEYAVRIQNYGWQEVKKNNEISGIPNSGNRVEVLRVNLTEELADSFDVYYRVYAESYGWLGWTKNGSNAGTINMNKRIEAVQIQIVNQGLPFVTNDNHPAVYGEIDMSTAPGQFITTVSSIVREEAPKRDLFSSVMIAQAALESGFGTSTLATEHNNLFGIKGKYNGQSAIVLTDEDDGAGNITQIEAEFKKYPTKRESFMDNGNKLANGVSWDPFYYRGSWKSVAKNYKNATQALQGKYATDTNYAEKLDRIIEDWQLTQFDY